MTETPNEVAGCKGFEIVPYGVSLSGTLPCEHRRTSGKCPDADKARQPNEIAERAKELPQIGFLGRYSSDVEMSDEERADMAAMKMAFLDAQTNQKYDTLIQFVALAFTQGCVAQRNLMMKNALSERQRERDEIAERLNSLHSPPCPNIEVGLRICPICQLRAELKGDTDR